MKFYPVFLNLKGKPVLVIGGGKVAQRKIRSLLSASAKVTVVAPLSEPKIQELARKGKISWLKRNFQPNDILKKQLVLCTTDSEELNAKVSELCNKRGIWINVADAPSLCSFIVPAIFSKGEVTIAISTGGASPALAKFLRKKAEQILTPQIVALSKILKKKRPQLLQFPLHKRKEVLKSLLKKSVMRREEWKP